MKSVLQRAQERIKKAFEAYQQKVEIDDLRDPADPETAFLDQVNAITRNLALDAASAALVQTKADIDESLADVKSLKEVRQ